MADASRGRAMNCSASLPKSVSLVERHGPRLSIPCGLPFFADPRNLETGKFADIGGQEASDVGF
jgi:hypothetical protein